jgi:hypothetical protein
VDQTAETARLRENNRAAMVESLRESIREETQASIYPLEAVMSGQSGPLTREQKQALKAVQNALVRLARSAEKTIPAESVKLN